MATEKMSAHVLPKTVGGGPCGVGDPDDKTLRKVEQEVLIPDRMRKRVRTEKCAKEIEEFAECAAGRTVTMVFACRKFNKALKECFSKWFTDPTFRESVENEYLAERTEFRLTGVKKNIKKVEGGHAS